MTDKKINIRELKAEIKRLTKLKDSLINKLSDYYEEKSKTCKHPLSRIEYIFVDDFWNGDYYQVFCKRCDHYLKDVKARDVDNDKDKRRRKEQRAKKEK